MPLVFTQAQDLIILRKLFYSKAEITNKSTIRQRKPRRNNIANI